MDWLPTYDKKRKLDASGASSAAADPALASPAPSSTTATTGGGGNKKTSGVDAAMQRQVVLLSKQMSVMMSITMWTWCLPEKSTTPDHIKAATTSYAEAVKAAGSSRDQGQPYQWAFAGLIRGLSEDVNVSDGQQKFYKEYQKHLTRDRIALITSSCRSYQLKNKCQVISWSPGVAHEIGEEEATTLHRQLVDTFQKYPNAIMFHGPAPKSADVRTIEAAMRKK